MFEYVITEGEGTLVEQGHAEILALTGEDLLDKLNEIQPGQIMTIALVDEDADV